MEIRDPKIRQQYKEAKEFIKKYEQEYNRVLYTNKTPFDPDIWSLKSAISYLLSMTKDLDIEPDLEHPFNDSIDHKRGILKARLKAKFRRIPEEV